MSVYVLTADTHEGNWGSEIELFGVFSTKEKAEEHARELGLVCFDLFNVNVDGKETSEYLGGYYE